MSFERIRHKIELLKKADPSFKLFGASSHRYTANAVATAQEIADWEGLHGITLPADYRDYLTQIGNGGVGPYYGIAGLDDHDYLAPKELAPNLQKAFPHRTGWNMPDSFFAEWSELQVQDDEAATTRIETEYWGPHWVSGAVEVCDYGCGLIFLLVVSGEERGNIWFDGRTDQDGIQPVQLAENPTGDAWTTSIPTSPERATLSQWIEGWLDHSLAVIRGSSGK